jgi:hypothetical protein
MKLISVLVISLGLVTAATAISYSDFVIAEQTEAAVALVGIKVDNDETWLTCAGPGAPKVNIVKHLTENKFRVIVDCTNGVARK